MYEPSTGRWMSEDSIAFSGGDVNFYRYVGNDVTNATDPTGLFGVFFDGLRYSRDDRTIISKLFAIYKGEEGKDKIYIKTTERLNMTRVNQAYDKIKARLAVNHKERIDIFGWSIGGMDAIALANKLSQEGIVVNYVGLIDPAHALLRQFESAEFGKLVDAKMADNIKRVFYNIRNVENQSATDALYHNPRPRTPPVNGEKTVWSLSHIEIGFWCNVGATLYEDGLSEGVPFEKLAKNPFDKNVWDSRPRGGITGRNPDSKNTIEILVEMIISAKIRSPR